MFAWSVIIGALKTVWSAAFRPMEPRTPLTLTGQPSLRDTLVTEILATTLALGPMPRTGGVICRVGKAEAIGLAQLIIDGSAKHGLDVAFVASLIKGESLWCARAINPNNNVAALDETAEQAFAHTDVGLAQVNGSVLLPMPEFAGRPVAEIKAKALSAVWAVEYVCSRLASDKQWAIEMLASDPSLKSKVPDESWMVLSSESYNVGRTGALRVAHAMGVKGNWKYGNDFAARYQALSKIFNA